MVVDFYGGKILFHSTGSTYNTIYSSLVQPNPNYPFTFTVILAENSAGNVTVQSIYINGTAYTVNVNTPFPWNQIGYIGIRTDIDNIFYVSYFSISQTLDVYSIVTDPYTNQQYSGTVYIAVFPYPISYDVFVSPAPVVTSQSPLPLVSSTYSYVQTSYPIVQTTATYGTITLWTTAGSVTASDQVTVIPSIGAYAQVSLSTSVVPNFVVNGTVRSGSVSGNTITLSGLSGTTTILFPVNFIPSGNYGTVTQYNATFDKLVTTASSVSFTYNAMLYEGGVPVFYTSLGQGWFYYGAYSSAGTYYVPLNLYTLAVGNEVYGYVPMLESTGWRVYPYFEDGELVFNDSSPNVDGQYIAWRYVPVSNMINITVHVTYAPQLDASPGIAIYSSNMRDFSSDVGDTGVYGLSIDFNHGRIWMYGQYGNVYPIYSSLPGVTQPYAFTFTVILTENSAGNITVYAVYINGTQYVASVNTPFPWNQIGYVGLRGWMGNLFYVSYFAVNGMALVSSSGVTTLNSYYSPISAPLSITNTSASIAGTQLAKGITPVVLNGTAGSIASSFIYFNTTSSSAVVIALTSPYISFTASGDTVTISANTPFTMTSLYGAPISGTAQFTYQDPTVTVYSSGSMTFVRPPTTTYTPPATTTTSAPPPQTTSSSSGTTAVVSPNSMTITVNGSVYISVNIQQKPQIYSPYYGTLTLMPFVNSSGAYVYLYYANQSADYKVDLVVENSSGVIMNESVPVNSVVQLPKLYSNATLIVTWGNTTMKVPISMQQLNAGAVLNGLRVAIVNGLSGTFLSPFADVLVVLFFASFFISAVFRNDLRLMGLGGIAYSLFIAPGLLQLGFPPDIIVPTMIVAFIVGVYGIYQAK